MCDPGLGLRRQGLSFTILAAEAMFTAGRPRHPADRKAVDEILDGLKFHA
uniref:Uncharacterized protein n=1 Tax=Rhodopseudomonas palustris (strain DX-1) TaxID=652103 RepID=E6VJ29_RHOPX